MTDARAHHTTTAQVIQTALRLGWRLEYIGGELPVLSNVQTPVPRPQGRPLGYTPRWKPVSFARCALCPTVRCVHGLQRKYHQRGRRGFCSATCRNRFRAAVLRQRRAAKNTVRVERKTP